MRPVWRLMQLCTIAGLSEPLQHTSKNHPRATSRKLVYLDLQGQQPIPMSGDFTRIGEDNVCCGSHLCNVPMPPIPGGWLAAQGFRLTAVVKHAGLPARVHRPFMDT